MQIPKVRAKIDTLTTFCSARVPPYIRKTQSLEAALRLHLKGASTEKMSAALEALAGSAAKGLSASTVTRPKRIWSCEFQKWCEELLDKDRWVYISADGVYSDLRAEQKKLCALVVIGVNERGQNHFLAIKDRVRESTQSYQEVLLKLKERVG